LCSLSPEAFAGFQNGMFNRRMLIDQTEPIIAQKHQTPFKASSLAAVRKQPPSHTFSSRYRSNIDRELVYLARLPPRHAAHPVSVLRTPCSVFRMPIPAA
jgi:hypothetical protein